MSTTVMSLCWPLQMPPTPKAVLISLADNANDQGACWPSISTIAQRTCFSERAIQGAIKWLEEHGALKADRSNGRHTTYVVMPQNYREPTQEMRWLVPNNPRSTSTPAPDAPPQEMRGTPAGDAPPPRSCCGGPPQEMPSNRNRTIKEPSGNRQLALAAPEPKFEPLKALLALGVKEQHAKDWLAIRKAKKAPLTLTALEGVQEEAAKARLTLPQAVKIASESGWQGFKADWLKPNQRGQAPRATEEQRLADNEEAYRLAFGRKESEVIDV